MKKFGLFFILNCALLASELNLKQLEELKETKLISYDDYLILKSEISNDDKLEVYTLKINGSEVDNLYKVLNKNNQRYLELETFFQSLNLKNYGSTDKIKLILGENLREIVIDLKNKGIYEQNKKIASGKNITIEKEEKIYLNEDIFKKLFSLDYRVDESKLKIVMALNFTPPEELVTLLDLRAQALENENKSNTLLYQSKKELFELGYARVRANKFYIKNSGEKKYNELWDGNLEYQGGLLYGQLQTNYNVKENILESIKLEYNDIWENHTLQFLNIGNEDRSRVWDLSFFKDKSYYIDNKNVIIRENVPIGSRVELKYMGASIAIKNAEDGVVIFDNPIITTDKTYTLVIFTPNGEVTEKTIKTTENFDQQSKGKFQYNINIRENDEAQRYTVNSEVYYGLTDRITIGGGYTRGIEQLKNRYEYVQDGRANIIYGDTINGYSYVLRLDTEKSFDDYVVDSQKYENKYKFGGLAQLSVKNWQYTYENYNFGEFYDNKKQEKFGVQYDLTSFLRLTYDYNKTYRYIGNGEKGSEYGLSIDKNIGKVLFSIDAKKSEFDEDEYSINAYYTTTNNVSMRLENKWIKSGKEYETLLSLYNNSYRGFLDYTFETGYSEKYKDKATFKMTIKLDDWFEIGSNFDKTGRQENKIGIDKIIDLKNPMKKVDSMDISRVKVTTFVDENNNNIYDNFEKLVEDVKVSIGTKTAITNENGEAILYGISNGLLHELNPEIEKPSFTMGDNKVTVKGTFSSTIDAYIPIKPMLNLNGTIKIDEVLNLKKDEIEELYQDILIEIKDLSGKSIELTVPDNTGKFDVSGLFPEEYRIEVSYLGTKYNLDKFNDLIKLSYFDDDFENKIVFNLNSKKISKAN